MAEDKVVSHPCSPQDVGWSSCGMLRKEREREVVFNPSERLCPVAPVWSFVIQDIHSLSGSCLLKTTVNPMRLRCVVLVLEVLKVHQLRMLGNQTRQIMGWGSCSLLPAASSCGTSMSKKQ